MLRVGLLLGKSKITAVKKHGMVSRKVASETAGTAATAAVKLGVKKPVKTVAKKLPVGDQFAKGMTR